ncbi:MAG: sigma-70 family RNA polymerase sigma factor [Acidobacteriota bacterium]
MEGVDFERELLARVAAGDEAAFEELISRHQKRLLHLCERLLGDADAARDAVQEVFLRVWTRAGRYRPRGQVYTWLYRIAVNYCLNRLRRRKVVRFLRLAAPGGDDSAPGESSVEPVDGGADPVSALESRERWAQTRRAIDALPAGQRAVLVLARVEGLSYRQVADVLEITVGAVESRLFRAMRTLENDLGASRTREGTRE